MDPVDQISKSNYATFANNPITYNDLNGDRWGVTLFFGETEAGGGIGLSSDYVKQHGTAYDEIGTTLFTASKFNVFNKDTDIHDSWDWSLGISASQSAAFAHSWNAELFSDIFESYSISKGFNIEGEYGIGGGLGVSMDMFSLQVGIGWGGKVSSINTKIDKSISFTDKEADMIDDKVGLGVFSSNITLSKPKEVNVNGVTMFKASIVGSMTMSDGKLKKVEIKIPVSCYSYKNEKGETVPNNIWKSDNYRIAEKKLKK